MTNVIRTQLNKNMTLRHQYDAFISYSHKADSELARTLQVRLERWARPWFSARTAKLFRDQTSLTATPHLWTTIAESLDKSRFLILLASTDSAKSAWVPKEIVYWLTEGKCENPEELKLDQVIKERVDRLMIVLTEGEIEWNHADGDFDWDTTTALHQVLRKLPWQPLWIDLRWARGMKTKEIEADERFKEPVLKLLSPIRGRTPQELLDANDKEQKRAVTLFRRLTIGLAIGFILVAISGYVAWQQRNTAIHALFNEQRERRLSTAREYAATASSLLNSSSDTALLFSLHANQVFDATDQIAPFFTQSSLFNSLEANYGVGLGMDDGTVQVVSLDNNRIVLAGVVSNQLRVRETISGQMDSLITVDLPPVRNPALTFEPRRFAKAPDDNWIAIVGNSPDQELCVVNLTTHIAQEIQYSRPERPLTNSDLNPPSIPQFAGDSRSFSFVDRTCHLHAFALGESGQWLHTTSIDLFPEIAPNPELRQVEHSFVDWSMLAVARGNNGNKRIDLLNLTAKGNELISLARLGSENDSIQLSSNDNTLYVWELNGGFHLRVFDINRADDVIVEHTFDGVSLPVDLRAVRVAAISPSGRSFVGTSSTGDTFMYSLDEAVRTDLGRFPDRATFLGETMVITTKQDDVTNVSKVELFQRSNGQAEASHKDVISLKGYCGVVCGDRGENFAVTHWAEGFAGGNRTILFDVTGDGAVIERDSLPLFSRYCSPDFTLFSDGVRLWDSKHRDSMTFPTRIGLPRYVSGTGIHMIKNDTVIYQQERGTKASTNDLGTVSVTPESEHACVVAHRDRKGRIVTSPIVESNVEFTRVCNSSKRLSIAEQHQCSFWSLSGDSPQKIGTLPISALNAAGVIDVALGPEGKMGLLVSRRNENDGGGTSIWIVDQASSKTSVQIEEITNCFALRTGWLSPNTCFVSAAFADEFTGGFANLERTKEWTRLYRISQPDGKYVASMFQEIPIGGQWVATSQSPPRICILSSAASISGATEIGSMFEVTSSGGLDGRRPIVKEQGQRRVEDLHLSSDGEWIAIVGNSPALYRRSVDGYQAMYLEVDGDRIDEMVISGDSKWAVSFTATNGFRSRVELWHLGNGNPNRERVRIRSLEGVSTVGRQLNVRFGERHIAFQDGRLVAAIGGTVHQYSLDPTEWRSIGLRMAGRNLSLKEIREQLVDGRSIEPLIPEWELPLSFEEWEGTH